MFSFWKNPVEKCTQSFPRCNVNRGKVTPFGLTACSAVYYQVPHWPKTGIYAPHYSQEQSHHQHDKFYPEGTIIIKTCDICLV
jgi:hypothetical protein